MVSKARTLPMASSSGMTCLLLTILRTSQLPSMPLEFSSMSPYTQKKGNQQISEIRGRINRTLASVYLQTKGLIGSTAQR